MKKYLQKNFTEKAFGFPHLNRVFNRVIITERGPEGKNITRSYLNFTKEFNMINSTLNNSTDNNTEDDST